MLLYILFIVFATLMSGISFAFIIGGLIKKKQAVWITSLVAFVVFSLLTVFAIVTYISESIDYMGSEEFQEGTRKQAENWGKNIGNTVSGAAQGLESSLDEEAIANLAEKSAVIAGKGIESMSKGFDETLGATMIYADTSVENAGIVIGRAEEVNHPEREKYNFGLYLEFQSAFEGTLRLTAYDSKGAKMANSELEIQQEAGDEKTFIFPFEYFEPGVSGYCILTDVTK